MTKYVVVERFRKQIIINQLKNGSHTNRGLAEANIFPHGLSAKEKQEADKNLLAMRIERSNSRSQKQQLNDSLLQLRYQMEDIIY